MKLTVLGSGTCASQLPGIANRYPPGFLIEFGDQRVLFECSEGVRFRLEQAGYDYSDIHHLAISHGHPDHYALIHYLQSVFCKGIWGGRRNEFLNVYCPAQIAKDFPKLWRIYLPERQDYEFPTLKFATFPAAPVSIARAKLSAAEVHHAFGKIPALSYRLETPEGVFVYSGDTGDCFGIREICRNADIFVCESSARVGDFQNATNYGHLPPYLAGEIAKNAGVKNLVLFHYTGLDSDEAILKDCRGSGYEGALKLAKDLMTIDLNR